MIDPEKAAEISRLYSRERLSMNEISKRLSVHHSTIRRVLFRRESQPSKPLGAVYRRLLEYDSYIKDKYATHPDLKCTRLQQLLSDRGLDVSLSSLRRYTAEYRQPKANRAYIKVRVLPGEQAQVDWGSFGTLKEGKATRKLSLFVMILSYSRMIYARFYYSQKIEALLAAHQHAFTYFGGSPDMILYDNMRTAVTSRSRGGIQYNEDLLAFSGKYCFKPQACNPYSGWEKGRVEKSIRFVRDNFFAARHFGSLAEANHQLSVWLNQRANTRAWAEDKSRRVSEVLEQDEKKYLRTVPEQGESIYERLITKSQKTPFIRFDLNNYSIPHEHVGKQLEVLASEEWVRIFCKGVELCKHARSYSRGEDVEDSRHVERLLTARIKARYGARKAYFTSLLSNADPFLERVEARGGSKTHGMRTLQRLFSDYGLERLNHAMGVLLSRGCESFDGLEFYLQEDKREPYRIRPDLSHRPELEKLQVDSHRLSSYGKLTLSQEVPSEDDI